MFPEAPYALAKLINLTHTPPVDEVAGDEIVPVPQPVVSAVSERWRRVWEVWTNAVRSAPSMVKSNPWLLFDRFWKHCGGRMADGHNALNFDPRLDSPTSERPRNSRWSVNSWPSLIGWSLLSLAPP